MRDVRSCVTPVASEQQSCVHEYPCVCLNAPNTYSRVCSACAKNSANYSLNMKKAMFYYNTPEERTAILQAKLDPFMLKIRKDSKLCNRFINGGVISIYDTLDELVERMVQLNYLYNYTNYSTLTEESKDIIRTSINYRHILNRLEMQALDMQGYPAKWPWLDITNSTVSKTAHDGDIQGHNDGT